MANKELTYLQVHIQPGTAQNKVVGYENGVLKLRIAAPPVEGKANRKLIEFLSDLLDIPRSYISIKSGLTSKQKTLVISNLTPEQLTERLPKQVV